MESQLRTPQVCWSGLISVAGHFKKWLWCTGLEMSSQIETALIKVEQRGFQFWGQKRLAPLTLHPACSEMQEMALGLARYGVLQGPNRASLADHLLTVAQRDILLTDRRLCDTTSNGGLQCFGQTSASISKNKQKCLAALFGGLNQLIPET